ncbi:hypothetical protein F4677DRAFT_435100 [Hypoxylon crocopeplum]|nr:hypothetical protein F4677DRAFT_435100 [Hypoxylon crocopeplum]
MGGGIGMPICPTDCAMYISPKSSTIRETIMSSLHTRPPWRARIRDIYPLGNFAFNMWSKRGAPLEPNVCDSGIPCCIQNSSGVFTVNLRKPDVPQTTLSMRQQASTNASTISTPDNSTNTVLRHGCIIELPENTTDLAGHCLWETFFLSPYSTLRLLTWRLGLGNARRAKAPGTPTLNQPSRTVISAISTTCAAQAGSLCMAAHYWTETTPVVPPSPGPEHTRTHTASTGWSP